MPYFVRHFKSAPKVSHYSELNPRFQTNTNTDCILYSLLSLWLCRLNASKDTAPVTRHKFVTGDKYLSQHVTMMSVSVTPGAMAAFRGIGPPSFNRDNVPSFQFIVICCLAQLFYSPMVRYLQRWINLISGLCRFYTTKIL